MSPQAGISILQEQFYRRLLAALGARARRSASPDPDAAARDTLARAFAHAGAGTAVEYYFSDNPSSSASIPEWPLDRLLAWWHETPSPAEIRRIAAECLPKLEPEYRRVLRLRAQGLASHEIAARLAMNESTASIWISRGTRDLARAIRKRHGTGDSAIKDDRLDRFARRDTNPDEARALAQEALDKPELFDELTWLSLAAAAVESMAGTGAHAPARRRWVLPVAIAALVIAGGAYWLLAPGKPLQPVIDMEEGPGHPVLLANRFAPAKGVDKLPPSRTPDSSGRGLQASGIVTSLEGREANINLGSLDGLSTGSEVQVFRDEQFSKAVARLVATVVSLERSRAKVTGEEPVKVNDRVRVSGLDFLHALLSQADAYALRDDLTAARETGERALTWAESSKVTTGERRRAVEHLAAIEYRAAMAPESESHFRWIVENLNAEPAASPEERADAWNSFAVLHVLRGDMKNAQRLLDQAHIAPGATGVAVARCFNNLGVLAELDRDRGKAARLYADALRAFGPAPETPWQDRAGIQANLSRVRGAGW